MPLFHFTPKFKSQIVLLFLFHAIFFVAADDFPTTNADCAGKIGANSAINLKILLEIRFLEVVREEKSAAKNAVNARKLNKTKSDAASAIFDDAENCASAEQNRTEQNRGKQNTTQQTQMKSAPAESGADAKNVVVCDFSKSSQTESREIDRKDSAFRQNSRALARLSDSIDLRINREIRRERRDKDVTVA